MKKIVVIAKVSEFDNTYGGMGKAVIFNYNILSEMGYDIHVVVPNLNLKKKKVNTRNIKFYSCDAKKKSYSAQFLKNSKTIVNEIKPDVIVAHSGAGRGIVDLPFKKIFLEHGHGFQFIETFVMEHYLISKKKNFKATLIKKMNQVWKQSRNYLEKYDRCVFLTETSAREVRERMLLSNVVNIPLSVSEIKTPEIDKKYDIIVIANSLSLPYKGFNYAKGVIDVIRKKTLVIGAKGRENRYIKYLGHVSPTKKVYSLMKQGKISLELSYHQSGLNMVKVESLYNGLGIVGWNVGSSYATIEEGKNGFIVPFNNKNLLKTKLLTAIDKYEEFGKNSKKIYEEKFSNKGYKKKWKELIENL